MRGERSTAMMVAVLALAVVFTVALLWFLINVVAERVPVEIPFAILAVWLVVIGVRGAVGLIGSILR